MTAYYNGVMSRARMMSVAGGLLLLILGTLALDTIILGRNLGAGIVLPDAVQNFITTFLGIFIEAAPFLLIGSLASGLVAVFISQDDLSRMIPKNAVAATLVGSLIGMVFPVCECGVVPLARRLYAKGLPASACISLLLGAPVLNPVVIASTYAAFGNSTVFWARLGFTFLIACGAGLVFIGQPAGEIMRGRLLGAGANLRASLAAGVMFEPIPVTVTLSEQLQRALGIAADDFVDTGRYLILGGMIASALQTFVPQSTLLSIGTNAVTGVIALQVLAYVLSVCSTVDSFLALSFVNTFSTGSIVAFLVFGAMVDIKSTIMFFSLLQRRVVLYLIVLLALAGLAVGLIVS